ncbi:MAG: C4-dicarboxylate ABC transporter permease, partial [Hyphomicrobium sp.]
MAEVEKLIEAEEGATNRVRGALAVFITAAAVVVTLFHLYAAYDVVSAQVLRPVHVGAVLFLAFLLFPMARRFR